MFKNTKLNLALFFIGLLIVIVTVASWFLFPEWRTTPQGMIQLIIMSLVGVVSLFGNLTQVLSYFRPQPPANAGPTAVSQGENAQSVVGDHNHLVQIGGGDYIENQIIQPAPPEAPALAPLFDVLPPSAAAGYVARGVETAVEAALLGRQGQPLALLNGPHGIGKTEAALQISRQLQGEFEHTLWIPLGSRPTDQVLPDYLRACGIKPPERKEEQIQALKAFLVQHRLLVVLDDLCAQQSADLEILLPPAPCAALLTSCIQQPSHLIPVNHSFPLEQMDREQGHALLENVLNGMVLSAEPEAVDDLIVKCAGNPLALEIAARRIQFMQGTPCPIQAYLEKLNKNLGELRSGHDSHLDLFAVFDQTYTALSPAEQLAFRTLSGCAPAGFSAEAAQALWQIDPAPSEEVLWQLQNVYFLKPVAGSRTRFRLHDLLYEYAGTKLSAAERETANQRLAGWLIALFKKHFTDNVSNAPEVALELDNLRQAIAWATQGQNAELLARLATQPRNWLLTYFCNYDEWLAWLQTALAGKIADPSLRANTLQAIGDVQQFKKQTDAALASYSAALDLFRSVGSRLGEASTLASQSRLLVQIGRTAEAEMKLQEALAVREQIQDRSGLGIDYGNFALALLAQKEFALAAVYAQKAHAVFQSIPLPDYVESVDQLLAKIDQLSQAGSDS
jgi:tetratricopeptide (TPR) repeat protein